MTAQRTTAGRVALFIGDGLFGLALFLVMACLVAGDGRAQGPQSAPIEPAAQTVATATSLALLGEPATAGSLSQAYVMSFRSDQGATVLRRADSEAARIMLAIVFSCLVALNLGFFRHLRRTYARSHRSHGVTSA